ncbi:bifunctional aspartate kinase/homoserine dehydrogenase I, partial [Francisella tularensis subsp. holarctica]|nr:bifunctional aspartate kinase/homoserine dehydrogenase I [Francisella tularensis subsp. holarctica]
ATAEKIKNVSNIINCKDVAVVVSASAKTTRNLQKTIDQATIAQYYSETLEQIYEHHNEIIKQLIPNDDTLRTWIVTDLANIKHILS